LSAKRRNIVGLDRRVGEPLAYQIPDVNKQSEAILLRCGMDLIKSA